MKAHRTDVVSFAFGLVFLALSVWWLLGRILGLTLPPVGWFLAGALILIGLLGLLGALRSGRHTDEQPGQPAAEAAVAAPYVDAAPAGGGPALDADEWATEAMTEVPTEVRQDHPAGREPHWAPAASAPPPAAPATRELPVVEPAASAGPGGDEAVTRELPPVDGPERQARPGTADGAGPDGRAPGREEPPG